MPPGATESVNEVNQEVYPDKFDGPDPNSNRKPKIVVIMGATGSGKSKLAIDLASHFPIEIINADSMQVYRGLDVLTNKVPLQEQKGVPHHLLGTISPSFEFTAKDFRDIAVPLINEIWARHRVPVIVGGTNYYIQALVTPFLLEDSMEEREENCSNDLLGDTEHDIDVELGAETECAYARLKELDPVAANRVHPNDQRKISQYLSLYTRFGVTPSSLLKEKTVENWGRVDDSKYDCCLICVDASLSVIDDFVGQRVDCMVDSGLLDEVFDIYALNADFTKGILQAIGVREFADFLRSYIHENGNGSENSCSPDSSAKKKKEHLRKILDDSYEDERKTLLMESIEKVKLNTRRLVRRQKRRLKRLQMLFGWNIHYVDATESLISLSEDIWKVQVVDPSSEIIRSFLNLRSCGKHKPSSDYEHTEVIERNLWTQYICEACGNKVLRGAHEWDEHRQGRHHRKRISRLKKNSEGAHVALAGQQHAVVPTEFKHLVLVKFKEEIVVEDVLKGMEKLVSDLDFVKSFEWGEDIESQEMLRQGFTHAFMMTFKNKEDFTAFLGHPNHVEFSSTFSTSIEKALLLDFPAISVKSPAA